MKTEILYAHFYGCKGNGFITITRNCRPVDGIKLPCSNKTEARRIAREYKAIPYNF